MTTPESTTTDWSDAPDEATHFGPWTPTWLATWYKQEKGHWYYMVCEPGREWHQCDDHASVKQEGYMIPRPGNETGNNVDEWI